MTRGLDLETHLAQDHGVTRTGWLRASVLGANDGLVSTASLLMGLIAAGAETSTVLLSGIAALVAGMGSMAAGELVSVRAQADLEQADLKREAQQIANDPVFAEAELAAIYRQRGLSPALADAVARELSAGDVLAAHARDELGIQPHQQARPGLAALSSALAFALGAAWPLAVVWWFPPQPTGGLLWWATALGLLLLGALSGYLGRAAPVRSAFRLLCWGLAAMAASAAMGSLLGVSGVIECVMSEGVRYETTRLAVA